jgi:imidazolonepropionase-like amidohydrolase
MSSRCYWRATRLVCCLIAALACAGDARPGAGRASEHPVIALVGAKIYPSPDAPSIADGVLLVRDGRVAAIGGRDAVSIPPGSERLDCTGSVIVAGFWNSHVHFTERHWNGADTARAEGLARHLREMLVRYGFVQVLDTGSWLENTEALRRRIDRGEIAGPAILTTGPGFVPEGASPFYILPDKLPELRSAGEARTRVAARLREGADAIKLFTGSVASPTRIVPMPLEVVRAATAEAHRQGKLVLAHPSNNEGLRAALNGGVDILAHTTPDGGPWDAAFAGRMKARGMSLIPTLQLWRFELSRRGADSATMERFLGVAVEQLRSYSSQGGTILFGTDVGYMTAYDPTDEYRYMQRAGMTFRQILTALTTAPAGRFGKAGASGTLEAGKDADLAVLEGNPEHDIGALARVRYVMRRGRLIFRVRGEWERKTATTGCW